MTTLIDTLPLRKAFTPDGLQLGWDSVSMNAAKKCPRYYLYSILMGYQPKMDNPHLKFGILFHAALERLDHIKVLRPVTDLDLASTLRKLMRDAGSTNPDTGEFIPWSSDHEKKNLESLVRSIIWYFDEYRNDAYSVIQLSTGAAAVELSFRFDTGLRHATSLSSTVDTWTASELMQEMFMDLIENPLAVLSLSLSSPALTPVFRLRVTPWPLSLSTTPNQRASLSTRCKLELGLSVSAVK